MNSLDMPASERNMSSESDILEHSFTPLNTVADIHAGRLADAGAVPGGRPQGQKRSREEDGEADGRAAKRLPAPRVLKSASKRPSTRVASRETLANRLPSGGVMEAEVEM